MGIEEKSIFRGPADMSGGGEDIPFQELTPEQTLATFDKYKDNEFYPVFVQLFMNMFRSSRPLRVFKKDKNLPLLILKLIKTERKDPLVDRNSRLVFDPFAHRNIRAGLYALYMNLPSRSLNDLLDESDDLAEAYTDAGLGYYWSSVRRLPGQMEETLPIGLPIGSRRCKPDRIDKDTWQMLMGPDRGNVDES